MRAVVVTYLAHIQYILIIYCGISTYVYSENVIIILNIVVDNCIPPDD